MWIKYILNLLNAYQKVTRTRADQYKWLPQRHYYFKNSKILIKIDASVSFSIFLFSANNSKVISKFKKKIPLVSRARRDKSIDL